MLTVKNTTFKKKPELHFPKKKLKHLDDVWKNILGIDDTKWEISGVK